MSQVLATRDRGTSPVYVICGPDQWLRDAALREVLTAVVGDPDDTAACSSFDADCALSEGFDELHTWPMLVPRKAVVLRDADAFIKDHHTSIEKYCLEPSPTAVLILVARALDQRTRLCRLIRKLGTLRNC